MTGFVGKFYGKYYETKVSGESQVETKKGLENKRYDCKIIL